MGSCNESARQTTSSNSACLHSALTWMLHMNWFWLLSNSVLGCNGLRWLHVGRRMNDWVPLNPMYFLIRYNWESSRSLVKGGDANETGWQSACTQCTMIGSVLCVCLFTWEQWSGIKPQKCGAAVVVEKRSETFRYPHESRSNQLGLWTHLENQYVHRVACPALVYGWDVLRHHVHKLRILHPPEKGRHERHCLHALLTTLWCGRT